MIKKILMTLVLVLFSIGIAFALQPGNTCKIADGAPGFVITEQGLGYGIAPPGLTGTITDAQYEAAQLEELSAMAGEDWTDGVIIYVNELDMYVLVHEGALYNCK